MALFALLILSAIGLGMMYSANTETTVNSNYGGSMRAYYGAVSGIEEARDRLRGSTATPISAPLNTPASTGGTIYIVNPFVNSGGTTVNPRPWLATDTYFDDEYCREFGAGPPAQGGATNTDPGVGALCTVPPFPAINTTWYGYLTGGATTYVGTVWHANAGVPSISPNAGTATAQDFRWTRIQMKSNYSTNPVCVNGPSIACTTAASQGAAVCWNGTNEFLAPANATNCSATLYQPVYLVTSLAVLPNGSRRMVQTEISQNVVPPLPAALVIDGAGPAFSTAHSQNYQINGVNANSCGTSPGPAKIPAIDTVNTTDQTTVTNELGKPDNYPGINPAPDVEVATTTQLGAYATIPGIVSIVQNIAAVADYVGTAPPTLGTTAAPRITVVTGSLSTCTGAGILVVTGNLHCNGAWSWNGTMLILGGTFLSNGGGGGAYYGDMLIAKAYDATATPPVPYTAVSSAVPNYPLPGAPSWTWNGGGGNSILNDSCWTTNLYSKFGFKVLSTRELNY